MLLARTEGRRAPQVFHKYASRRIETERKPPRTETVPQFELSTFTSDMARVDCRFADKNLARRILVERVMKALGPTALPGRTIFNTSIKDKKKRKRWTHTRKKTAHSRLSVTYIRTWRKELYCACVRIMDIFEGYSGREQ